MRKNLKEARQRAGMTQQQMADRLEIRIIRLAELCRVHAAHVGMKAQWLLGQPG